MCFLWPMRTFAHFRSTLFIFGKVFPKIWGTSLVPPTSPKKVRPQKPEFGTQDRDLAQIVIWLISGSLFWRSTIWSGSFFWGRIDDLIWLIFFRNDRKTIGNDRDHFCSFYSESNCLIFIIILVQIGQKGQSIFNKVSLYLCRHYSVQNYWKI